MAAKRIIPPNIQSHTDLTNWRHRSWSKLESIWRELVGPIEERNERVRPSFEGMFLTNRDAGYVFQTWIIQALRANKADVIAPFVVASPDGNLTEQIDGLLFHEGTGYLIESKFGKVDFGPISRLHVLVNRRPPGTMGMLFSTRGFTPSAIDSMPGIGAVNVLLFNRWDLEHAVAEKNLVAIVHQKRRLAVKFGQANLPTTFAVE